jgi:hypothetical protein
MFVSLENSILRLAFVRFLYSFYGMWTTSGMGLQAHISFFSHLFNSSVSTADVVLLYFLMPCVSPPGLFLFFFTDSFLLHDKTGIGYCLASSLYEYYFLGAALFRSERLLFDSWEVPTFCSG